MTGLDLSEQAIAECDRKFNDITNLEFRCEDIFEHRGRYDFIYTIEALEHIQDPDPIIARLCELTDRILIIVPNFLARYDNPEGRALMWKRHEHYHIGFSSEDIATRLERHGFSILDARQIYFENLTKRVRQLMDHMLEHYPLLVQNDMQFLRLMARLYDLDPRCSQWLAEGEEGEGTLVYAERHKT